MKKPFIYLLTAGLAFSMIANTGQVKSAEQSNATVTFYAPTNTVNPVDPENPGEDNPNVPPEEGTQQAGPLSLDYISDISFDEHEITTEAESHSTITDEPYVQVTDRRGTGEGWNLQATAHSFTIDGENTLPGSTISFLNGGTLSALSTAAPELNSNIVLSTGGEAEEVMTAAAKEVDGPISSAQGLGTWVASWLTTYAPDSDIILSVPEAASSPGAHTAIIDWTLTNAPQNGVELQ